MLLSEFIYQCVSGIKQGIKELNDEEGTIKAEMAKEIEFEVKVMRITYDTQEFVIVHDSSQRGDTETIKFKINTLDYKSKETDGKF